ncbi:hypothetical protein N0V90_011751 [Kalmusia sp. IMI 367209]|nr:hypothetical protein N0V90_011751 [Kalmusia sp. IMI 367209]
MSNIQEDIGKDKGKKGPSRINNLETNLKENNQQASTCNRSLTKEQSEARKERHDLNDSALGSDATNSTDQRTTEKHTVATSDTNCMMVNNSKVEVANDSAIVIVELQEKIMRHQEEITQQTAEVVALQTIVHTKELELEGLKAINECQQKDLDETKNELRARILDATRLEDSIGESEISHQDRLQTNQKELPHRTSRNLRLRTQLADMEHDRDMFKSAYEKVKFIEDFGQFFATELEDQMRYIDEAISYLWPKPKYNAILNVDKTGTPLYVLSVYDENKRKELERAEHTSGWPVAQLVARLQDLVHNLKLTKTVTHRAVWKRNRNRPSTTRFG